MEIPDSDIVSFKSVLIMKNVMFLISYSWGDVDLSQNSKN